MNINWKEFFMLDGEPLIIGSQIAILLSMVGVVAGITYFKKWRWLWTEWLTTVDHKK